MKVEIKGKRIILLILFAPPMLVLSILFIPLVITKRIAINAWDLAEDWAEKLDEMWRNP